MLIFMNGMTMSVYRNVGSQVVVIVHVAIFQPI